MSLWIAPLALLISFECIADILAKEYSLHNSLWYASAALLEYLIANVYWLFAIKNGSGLARGAIIFYVASAILVTCIGLLLYKEQLSRIQIVGILVGIASLALIFWQ